MIEVDCARQDHREHRDQRACPEGYGDLRDRVYATIQQGDVEDPDHRDESDHPWARESRPDVARVLGETDVARRDLERSAQHELPDEEKPHESAEALSPECLAQIVERSA